MEEAYKDANVSLPKNLTKRSIEKQKADIIEFIRNNSNCSISEIKEKTQVNVIRVFGSIINAYNEAGIEYIKKPVTSGVVNQDIFKRAQKFERLVFNLLSNLGHIKTQVRTKIGIIDCVFNYRGTKFLVEIKDYRGKNNITMFEIKQLLRYLIEMDCRMGLLVCPKENFPKRKNSRNIYIANKVIKIVSEEDLRGRSTNLLSLDNWVQSG